MMNDTYQQVFPERPLQPLPNSTLVLVLGILSILGCCCYGVVGVILGIIAIVMANKDQKLYYAHPGVYTEGSYNNLKAGKICAIVSIVLSSLHMIFYIVMIMTYGLSTLTDPDAMREILGNP